MEIKLNEIEVRKLNLQPGEVLFVTVKSDLADPDSLDRLGAGLRMIFPLNKVVVLSTEPEGSIELTIGKGLEYPDSSTKYCQDCSCGKKEAAEGNGNETT